MSGYVMLWNLLNELRRPGACRVQHSATLGYLPYQVWTMEKSYNLNICPFLRLWHPNISEEGEICLSLLRPHSVDGLGWAPTRLYFPFNGCHFSWIFQTSTRCAVGPVFPFFRPAQLWRSFEHWGCRAFSEWPGGVPDKSQRLGGEICQAVITCRDPLTILCGTSWSPNCAIIPSVLYQCQRGSPFCRSMTLLNKLSTRNCRLSDNCLNSVTYVSSLVWRELTSWCVRKNAQLIFALIWLQLTSKSCTFWQILPKYAWHWPFVEHKPRIWHIMDRL